MEKINFIQKLSNTEYIFLTFGLIFGILLVFANPPYHSNDEDRHFYCSYFIASGQIIPVVKGNEVGGYLPVNLLNVTNSFQGIPYFQGKKVTSEMIEKAKKVELEPHKLQFYHNYHFNHNPISYLPFSIGILVGKQLDSRPIWLMWFGRIAGLIFYIAIIFIALKLMPIMKNAFMLMTLTPMTLYQAASITYDTPLIAFTFLFIALVLKYNFTNETIGWKELLAIAIVLIFHRYSKDGYIFIPFLFYILPMYKFGSKRNAMMIYIGYFLFVVFLYFLPNLTWGAIISSLNINYEALPKIKRDYLHDRALNLSYQLQQPLQFIGNIIMNSFHFKEDWIAGAFGKFGYSYTKMPTWIYIIHGLLLISVAFFDSSKLILSNKQKLLIFGVAVISAMAIIVGFYLDSPVGNNQVFGLQGRYFIPIIPLFMLSLSNNNYIDSKFNKYFPLISGLYLSLFLTYTVIFISINLM